MANVFENFWVNALVKNKTSSSNNLIAPKQFRLFGIPINNVDMTEAVDWITNQSYSESQRCRVACFVNTHSVNSALANPSLLESLNCADRCFADGSGMRIAARHSGIQIKDNVNGTDLLPALCERLCSSNQSLYLLGGEPGIAKKAALNLKNVYPTLQIAGYQHGYFEKTETSKVIADINQSKADVLLVAFGSPRQEAWLLEHSLNLNCAVGLAVGGLLDFVAGKFSRAPAFLRERGLEWIWRLCADPRTKFYRYVIGNPLFLFRTFIQNKTNAEVLS